MAKRRKRGTKTKKVQRSSQIKEFIIKSFTADAVTVPDFAYRVKKKYATAGGDFVDPSCVHQRISLPYVGVVAAKQKTVGVTKLSRVSKGKGTFSQIPFVSAGCITQSITPVRHFAPGKSPACESPSAISQKRNLRVWDARGTAFVNEGCITQQVSLPYVKPSIKSQERSYVLPVTLKQTYQIVLSPGRKRRKRVGATEFVSPSCISGVLTMVPPSANQGPPPKLVNPYPPLPALAPEIVGGFKIVRQKKGIGESFVTDSCRNATVSQPLANPVKEAKPPKVTYQYVDRPNSPDIHGPENKKTRKHSSKVVAFVPKSCTVEQKPTLTVSSKKEEALARTAPVPEPRAEKNNWLALVAFVGIIAFLVIYFLK